MSNGSQQDHVYSHRSILTDLQPVAHLYTLVALPVHSLPIHFVIYCFQFLFIMASTPPKNLLFSHTSYFLLSYQSFPCYQLTKSSNLSTWRVACISALALPPPGHDAVRGSNSHRNKSITYNKTLGSRFRTPRIIKLCNLNSSSFKSSFVKPQLPPVN